MMFYVRQSPWCIFFDAKSLWKHDKTGSKPYVFAGHENSMIVLDDFCKLARGMIGPQLARYNNTSFLFESPLLRPRWKWNFDGSMESMNMRPRITWKFMSGWCSLIVGHSPMERCFLSQGSTRAWSIYVDRIRSKTRQTICVDHIQKWLTICVVQFEQLQYHTIQIISLGFPHRFSAM